MSDARRAAHKPRPSHFEHLEPRALPAGNFAFVGITAGNIDLPTTLAWGEGILADDGSVTGSQTTASLGGAPQTGTLAFDHATRGPGGTFTVTAAPGQPAITDQVGANPFSSDGFGTGFLTTIDDRTFGPARTDLWMFEKNFAFAANSTGQFNFRAIRITSTGQDVINGSLTFVFDTALQPTGVSWVVGGDAPVIKNITAQTADGKFVLDTGEVIFITSNVDDPSRNTVVLIADLDGSDGEMLAGIGGAASTIFLGNSAYIHGLYRGMAAVADAGAAFFGTGISPTTAFVLDLKSSGNFSLYEARAYDSGARNPVNSGTWRVSVASDLPLYAGNRVLLTSSATLNTAVFEVLEDFTLVGESIRSGSGAILERFASGARTFLPLNLETQPRTITVDLDDTGHPILYHHSFTAVQGVPDVWYSLDLIARAGGKPLTDVQVMQLTESFSTWVVAGVATDGHAVVWERDVRGVWLFRDLTDLFSAQGALPITGDTAIFRGVASSKFRLFITGLDSAGDLVSYSPAGTADDYGVENWTYTNVSQEGLAPDNVATPIWRAGSVFGFGTNWGALNVAGLNIVGQIVVAWTAPGLDRWFVSNLSDIAGTVPLAGSLMAYVTDWNAIHINGLSPDGRLIVTWWAPANGGIWYANDLTTDFAGPPLPPTIAGGAPNTLVFFEGLAGSLNVAAIDVNGDTVIYWWHPGAPGWMTGNLTSAVAPADRPALLVSADTHQAVNQEIELATQQSVYGTDENGNLVRLYWDDHLPDLWRFEDIAATAIELPV